MPVYPTRNPLWLSTLALAAALPAASEQPSPAAEALPQVVIETSLGAIRVEVDTERAPLTARNFLAYVDRGFFEGASFYRAVRDDNQPDSPVKIDVIQGGLGFDDDPRPLPPIAHETTETTGIRHLDGVISMARAEPGTASSELFLCVGDQPALDFGGARNPDGAGFAAFGRVLEGMEVVREIHRRPAAGQMLEPEVPILAVSRAQPGAGDRHRADPP